MLHSKNAAASRQSVDGNKLKRPVGFCTRAVSLKNIFGMLNGAASVQASGSAREIAMAREDCVAAVVEDLIAKKIVPTINSKAGTP